MVKRAGEAVHVTRFDTVMGAVTLASTPQGVVACTLPGKRTDEVGRWLMRHMPDAEVVEGLGRNARAVRAVRDYLAGVTTKLDVRLDLRGTPFQLDVWRTLRRVPFGRTISYGELAARSGHPRASRACGSANGANPVPLFVPCHRVIAGDGTIGGFGGSLPLKRKLLALENVTVKS